MLSTLARNMANHVCLGLMSAQKPETLFFPSLGVSFAQRSSLTHNLWLNKYMS